MRLECYEFFIKLNLVKCHDMTPYISNYIIRFDQIVNIEMLATKEITVPREPN